MSTSHLLRQYPGRRISVFDGMTVTADVWREAHEYHLYLKRIHALNGHGVGIITGLDVIATQPASQSVYILPGVAYDPGGNTIVVPEPAVYDLSRARDGLHHLLLTYEESRPQPMNGQFGDRPFYVLTGYNVETVSGRTDTPQIELARVRRQGSGPINNPESFRLPRANEIDLRFRPDIAPLVPRTVRIGVVYLTEMAATSHGLGLNSLARTVSQQREIRAWVDNGVTLDQDLEEYTLLALVAKDSFTLTDQEVDLLAAYLAGGGTLFLESCHREGGVAPRAEKDFDYLVQRLGIDTRAVHPHHPLLEEPHLFSRPPVGYESEPGRRLELGGGLLHSTYDYACLWRGDRRAGPAQREEIRAALEWGQNLLVYAWNRRAQAERS